jgi:glycosyltransferase involved in cell wall biosynthesis
MTEANYPKDPLTRRSYLWIERKTIQHATHVIFTAPSTRQMYLDRYPHLPAERCLVITNGYDEEDFTGIETAPTAISANGRPLRLLHAGVIYTDDRDPRAFFRALSRLKRAGAIDDTKVVIDLRASGSENYYASMLKELQIDDIVRLLSSLPHHEALQDCARADALLLFQAASCNHQIPAKAYEYLRLRKPILALTPREGDTANLLTETDAATIVDLADEEAIYQAIPNFLRLLKREKLRVPEIDLTAFSRRQQSAKLAVCLNEVASK